MFWNQYPYINLNDLNLDYLLNKLKELEQRLVDFIKINTIKYADPIQWNITTQYEANTVVIDGNTGTAYLSTQPVPSGIALTNTDYWTVIFTLDILSANQNITFRNDGANVIATFESNVDDWLLWNSQLYKVIRHIAINEAYVEGYNLTRYSVELFIREYITLLNNMIGTLSDLTTSDTDSIVDAINSIITERGALSDLTTTDTDSIVEAINSIITERGALSDLTTTDTDSIVEAINSIVTNDCCIRPEQFGAVGDGVANDTAAVQACFNSADRLTKKIVMTGKYKLTNRVTINSNTHIEGFGFGQIIDGWNNTIVTPTYLDCSLIGSNGVNNIEISGLNFIGTGALSHYIQEYIIRLENSTDITIKNSKFFDIPAVACVIFSNCDRCLIDGCYIKEYTRGGFMLQGGTSNSTISHCMILNGNETQEPNRYPISLCAYEIAYSADNPAPEAYNNMCLYNYIEDTSPKWEAIDAHGGNNFTIRGNIMIGTATGISAFSDTARGFTTYRVQVTDNVFVARGASQTGVSNGFAITANESVISGNVIINAGRYATSGFAYGMYISTVGANSIISDNVLLSCGKYGIVTSCLLGNIKFSNNIINYVAPVNDESCAFYFNDWPTWSHTIIENNIFRGPIGVIVRAPSVKQNNYSAVIMRNNIYGAVAPTFENIANIAPDLATEADIALSTSGEQGLICRNYNAAVGHPAGFVFVASNPLQNAGSWHNLANIV